jgi:hypothetical protein
MGSIYKQQVSDEIYNKNTDMVQEWLKNQGGDVCQSIVPSNSKLNAGEYQRIWKKLNGV